ncbi:MAG: aspartate aminotransferase family protein [Acidobacteria bacterium]|nr:aspartate aminotransferase family protein [Acidobacteriota bacterium]
MHEALRLAYESSLAFRRGLPDRPVGARATLASLRATLGGPLGDAGQPPAQVIADLVRHADPGLMAEPGPRYFGFVIGGSSDAAVGADWLSSAWDQNSGLYATSPALAVVEETCARWLLELLGLPERCGVGFVTGCQMAHFTCLAAARHELLRRAGWDVEQEGLQGSPRLHVVVGDEVHVTVPRALRFLGLGAGRMVRVPADAQGRMIPSELAKTLQHLDGPTLVCAQVGNVNTGALDDVDSIADACALRNAWLHVDGAFGLWAAAVPGMRGALKGIERADSWATDAHKWLNVPYDSGLAIVKDARAHRAAMTVAAAYLIQQEGDAARDAVDWVPEFSRRARGFPIYAQLRALGRDGVAALIARSCALARRAAEGLAAIPGATVLNEVALNQVLVRFTPPDGGDADAFTKRVVEGVQAEGTCWLSGSTWHGLGVMRVSISGQDTTEDDIDRSVAAIRKVVGH